MAELTRPRLRVELNFGTGPYAPGVLVWDQGNWDVGVWGDAGAVNLWPSYGDAFAGSLGSGSAALPSLIWDSPTQGTWDNNAWAADSLGEGFWTDLADYCESVSIRSGRKRALESFSAARMTAVLDNSDRRFDPTNLAGPYVVGTFTAIVPMRPVRVMAEWGGVEYPLVFAYADSWGITWQDPAVSTTVLSATDAFKVLSDFDPLEVAPVGAGEDSGARVNRVLDNAGWSATARDVDTGNSTLQATNLSANALTELKLIADSELGSIYVAPDGKVTFDNRHARISGERAVNVQAVFGDAGTATTTGGGYGELPYGTGTYGGGTETTVELSYAALAIAYDDETVKNRANIARVGGTTQTASDAASIGRNLTHTHSRSDLLLETDSAAGDYARVIVARNKDNELRFDSLVLEPDGDDALWPVALGLRFGDRIKVRRRPPGGGALIERECFIEGKDIDMPARGLWRFTFALSDAAADGDELIWDHPTRGLWDAAVWAF